ncbi:hypothetical protein CFL01nite_13330 [Corynebacterium flavescens]|uniref:Uncharacterized protein n=1 Tax=Corynebacterium flavescens TaxID=28028 RepID=A0AB73B7H9_CORFL|nr:hypothetical protein CFL01nite_13330 [Corynebacterium flavescens]
MGTQIPMHREGGDDEGDESHIHGIKGPAKAGADEEFLVFCGYGQPVEAFTAREHALYRSPKHPHKGRGLGTINRDLC